MSGFFYWSIVIVLGIMLVKNAWSIFKFAVKAWYTFFAILIVGVVFFTVLLPILFKLLLY
jgi:hypothetical protein